MTRTQTVVAAVAIACGCAVPAEGLRQVAYRDPVGVLTVCYGDTDNIDPRRVYSLDECKARLADDMRESVDEVERCTGGRLNANQLAAFSDAVYNLGATVACDPQRSTAARLIREGNYDGACKQLPRWDKASVGGVMVSLPGLTKRRAKEMELCLTPIGK